MGIHRTGPCLASQRVEGRAGLQDVVRGLRTCATWTFVWMGSFQSVEVGEELTVSSSVWRFWQELLCPAGGCCPLLSQCLGVVATLSWSCFLRWSLLLCRTWGVQIAPACFPFASSFKASRSEYFCLGYRAWKQDFKKLCQWLNHINKCRVSFACAYHQNINVSDVSVT